MDSDCTMSQSVDDDSESRSCECSDRQQQSATPHALTGLFALFRLNDTDFHAGHYLPGIGTVSHVLKIISRVLTCVFQQDPDSTRMLRGVLCHLREERGSAANSGPLVTDIIHVAVNDDPQGLLVVVFGDFRERENGVRHYAALLITRD